MAIKKGSGGGFGAKGGKPVNKFVDLSDITISESSRKVLNDNGHTLLTSRNNGDYKRVIELTYNPVTGHLLIVYES